MIDTIRSCANITAPEDFADAVKHAALSAVTHPKRRVTRRMYGFIILCIILLTSAVSAAAVRGWIAAGDLFNAKKGFVLPEYEWGSSASVPHEDTLLLYDLPAKVSYQYVDDRLISIDMVIDKGSQSSASLETLLDQITADMNANYESVPEDKEYTPAEGREMQAHLRKALGLPEDLPKLEAERAGSARNTKTWVDQNTNTALMLTVGYDDGSTSDIRVIKISLARFNHQ